MQAKQSSSKAEYYRLLDDLAMLGRLRRLRLQKQNTIQDQTIKKNQEDKEHEQLGEK